LRLTESAANLIAARVVLFTLNVVFIVFVHVFFAAPGFFWLVKIPARWI